MAGGSGGSGATETAVDSAGGPARDPGSLPRGTSVGRYVVLERLGAGGMGVVYSAFDPELDRKVALKLLYGHGSSAARARLVREAQSLARLTDPGVVTVHDVGTHDDRVFVAMELVPGRTLTEWQRAAPRTWREATAMWIAAGRGLAAVHAAGLVHRDFKPDNVMVADDGRVRVMDFGLARESADEGAHAVAGDAGDPATSGVPALTQAGARMGTPAYMAPEQHLGLRSDARTDQFGFCVGLYEALYGERPFRAATLTALALEVTEGRIQPAPRGASVPAWLRRVIVRGLSVDPAQRWPDMRSLLHALDRDPGRRVRQAALGLASAAALVGVGLWVADAGPGPCEGASARLTGVWDDGTRARAAAAFADSGLSFAEPAWARTRAAVDDWAARWTSMHTEACVATHVTGEQSAELLDLRMACLDDRRAELSALAQRLQTADAAVIERAAELFAELGPLEACADADALREPLPPPDAATRERVGVLRGELAGVRLSLRTGEWIESRAVAERIAADARSLAYAPVLAEALIVLAELQRHAGEPGAARITLEEAFAAAAEGRRDDLAADAWLEQLWIVAEHERLPLEALRLIPIARAAVVRAGDRPDHRAALSETLGLVYELAERPEEALAPYQRALELLEAEHGPTDPRVAAVLANLGDVLRKLRRGAEARAHLDRAIEIVEAELGPDHPAIATYLGGLARLDADAGDRDGAQARWERALALREQVLGPDHVELAITLVNLANIALERGDIPRSLAFAERAERIRTRHYAPGHPRVISVIGLQARAHHAAGDLVRAEALFARAVAQADAAGRPADPGYLHGVGNCRMALGRPADAVEPFERALAATGTGSDGTSTPALLATRRFSLAQALAASRRDPSRARSLAHQARAEARTQTPPPEGLLRDIDTWLRTPRSAG
jgi:tetratricopeptide (TPR) repeat protein